MKENIKLIYQACFWPYAILPFAYAIHLLGTMLSSYHSSFLLFENMNVLYLKCMPLFICACVAIQMSKKKDGSILISAIICWFLLTNLFNSDLLNEAFEFSSIAIDSSLSYIKNPLLAVFCGVVSAYMFDHFSTIKLPACLAFFSGKRLVPILLIGVVLMSAIPLYFIWVSLFDLLMNIQSFFINMGEVGMSISKTYNTLLLAIGLPNSGENFYIIDGMNTGSNLIYTTFMPFIISLFAMHFYRKKNLPLTYYLVCIAILQIGDTQSNAFLFFLIIVSPYFFLSHSIILGITTLCYYNDYALPLLYLQTCILYTLSYFLCYKKKWINWPKQKDVYDKDYLEKIIMLFGGIENIKEIDVFKHRLFIIVYDKEFVHEEHLETVSILEYQNNYNEYSLTIGSNAYTLKEELIKLQENEMQNMIL